MLPAQPITSWESLDDDARERESRENEREREREREREYRHTKSASVRVLIYVIAHLYTYVHTHTFTHACVYARTHTTSPRIQRVGSEDIVSEDIVSISALVTIPDISLCPFFLRIIFFWEFFNFRYSNF